MVLHLPHLPPPSLSPDEESAYRAWLQTQSQESGFPDGARAIRQPTLVRDGRQEFSHFWIYPLLAAPATGIATIVGAHPLAAFTVTNALLLGAALWATARTFGPIPALLLISSPIFWGVAVAEWVADRRAGHHSLLPHRAALKRALAFALSAVGVALLHPAYYLLRLG